MIKYMKPMVLELDDIAEGIYAASGNEETNKNEENEGGDKSNEGEGEENSGSPENNPHKCWTVTVYRDGGDDHRKDYSQWRIQANHDTSVWHISKGTILTVVFSRDITAATYEGNSLSVSGATATLRRDYHGNSDISGDNFNSLLEVYGPDTHTMTVVSATIECIMAQGVNQPT